MRQRCIRTRNEFLVIVGTVNAEIVQKRHGLRYETKYRLVAERIANLGHACGANVLSTVTDDGLYVVSIKGFRQV
jgi:hypothetical protein